MWVFSSECLVPISILITVLNTGACFLTLKSRPERRKPTTMLLLSMHTSDLLFGAILLPVKLIETLINEDRIFPYIYCYILFVSVFNAILLATDRYFSSVKPLKRLLVSTRNVTAGLTFAWLCPVLISLLPLTWCFTVGYNSIYTEVYRYILVSLLCCALIVVVSLQASVMWNVFRFWRRRKRHKSLRNSKPNANYVWRRKLRATVLIVSLLTSTIITWLPTIILNFHATTSFLVNFSLLSLLVNSLVDPIFIFFYNWPLVMAFCKVLRYPLARQSLSGLNDVFDSTRRPDSLRIIKSVDRNSARKLLERDTTETGRTVISPISTLGKDEEESKL